MPSPDDDEIPSPDAATFPSTAEFYSADPRRSRSLEIGIGREWPDTESEPSRGCALRYLPSTAEICAFKRADGEDTGCVDILGSLPFLALVELVLEGHDARTSAADVTAWARRECAWAAALLETSHALGLYDHEKVGSPVAERADFVHRSAPDGLLPLDVALRHPDLLSAALSSHSIQERVAGSHWVGERLTRASRVLELLQHVGAWKTDDGALFADVKPVELATVYDPATKLLSDQWTVEDSLGFRAHCDAIVKCLEHEDTRPPLTIGVIGEWGSGKTSFMRMLQRRLESRVQGQAPSGQEVEPLHSDPPRLRDALASPQHTEHDLRQLTERLEGSQDSERSTVARSFGTVWFNPWLHQRPEELWAGLAHEIIAQVTARLPARDREWFWFRLTMDRLDTSKLRERIYRAALVDVMPWLLGGATALLGLVAAAIMFGLALGVVAAVVAVLAVVGGAGVLAALRRVLDVPVASMLPGLLSAPLAVAPRTRSVTKRIAESVADSLQHPDYLAKVGAAYLTVEDVRRVVEKVANDECPLVVFIDDLDRCSSQSLVATIEALNTFFSGEIANVVFIIALDADVVARHVGTQYSHLTDAASTASAVGWRFLEKFIQVPVAVPRMDVSDGSRLISQLFDVPPSAGEDAAETGERRERDHVVGTPVPASDLRPLEDILYVQLRDSSAEIRAVLAKYGVPRLRKPRDIKRFVNVFRFYAFIQRTRQAYALPSPEGPETIAKLALLPVVWPEWVGRLVLASGDVGGKSTLERLEDELRRVDQAEGLQALASAVGAASAAQAPTGSLRSLYSLLTTEPAVGRWASLFL